MNCEEEQKLHFLSHCRSWQVARSAPLPGPQVTVSSGPTQVASIGTAHLLLVASDGVCPAHAVSPASTCLTPVCRYQEWSPIWWLVVPELSKLRTLGRSFIPCLPRLCQWQGMKWLCRKGTNPFPKGPTLTNRFPPRVPLPNTVP